MNEYEAKQHARKARLQARAQGLAQAAQGTFQRAREMASVIPFGQPVLTDHYSAGRDMRYRNRIHNTFGKSFQLQEQAAETERRAEVVGTGGISSDDPEAIPKLRAELQAVEAAQERMVAANRVIRAHKTPEKRTAALLALGFSQLDAEAVLKPDFMGRVGFAGYALQNNNANGRRIKGRIAELEERALAVDVTEEHPEAGYTYREDVSDNRIQFIFDGRPDSLVRSVLKGSGFKWSPTRGAWIRQLNNAGRYAASRVKEHLANGQ